MALTPLEIIVGAGYYLLKRRYLWSISYDKSLKGAQIDLIFDRIDQVISLCEIKYCSEDFIFDKKLQQELLHKQTAFIGHTKCKKQIFWSLITSLPVKRNNYYDEIITHNVVLEDLF